MTCVYVIEAQGGPVKIGIATNPQSLLAALRTGTPFPLRLAHVEDPGELDAVTVEKAAHAILKAARVHGEWFSVSVDEARKAVQDTIERLRQPPTSVVAAAISCPMITGRQIREARALLGLYRSGLAAKSKIVTIATITRAEAVDGEPPITTAQATAIKQALERAGVDFTSDPPGVRIRGDEL